MHSAAFYYVNALAFPLALSTLARAIKLRWAATSAAAVLHGADARADVDPAALSRDAEAGSDLPARHAHGDAVVSGADHRSGGVHRSDHAPVRRQARNARRLRRSSVPVFVATFVAVQWPFASFLVYSPLARGPLFNAENFVYWMSPVYEAGTRQFRAAGRLADRAASRARGCCRDGDERRRPACAAHGCERFVDEAFRRSRVRRVAVRADGGAHRKSERAVRRERGAVSGARHRAAAGGRARSRRSDRSTERDGRAARLDSAGVLARRSARRAERRRALAGAWRGQRLLGPICG